MYTTFYIPHFFFSLQHAVCAPRKSAPFLFVCVVVVVVVVVSDRRKKRNFFVYRLHLFYPLFCFLYNKFGFPVYANSPGQIESLILLFPPCYIFFSCVFFFCFFSLYSHFFFYFLFLICTPSYIFTVVLCFVVVISFRRVFPPFFCLCLLFV